MSREVSLTSAASVACPQGDGEGMTTVKLLCHPLSSKRLQGQALLLTDILMPDVGVRRNVLGQEGDASGVMEIIDDNAVIA